MGKSNPTISVIVLFQATLLFCFNLRLCVTQLAIPDDVYHSHIADQQFVKRSLAKPIPIQRRTKYEPPAHIIEAIDDKIKELKAFFEDSTANEIDDKTDEDEETTIIEFVPNLEGSSPIKQRSNDNDPLATNIRKYQKMRDKIKSAFEKERVSSKIKRMIIKTVDDMIANLVAKQCEWSTKQKQTLDAQQSGVCYFNNTRLSRDDCRSIVQQYFANIKSNLTQNGTDLKQNVKEDFLNTAVELKDFFGGLWRNHSLKFLNTFTQTVSDVMNDAQNLSSKYKVKCSLIEIGSEQDVEARRSGCDNFKICTQEFRHYLIDFYNMFNDTAVSVFRNYAEMYAKDVNSDASDEKVGVIKTINDLSNTVESRVIDAFIGYLPKLKLDESKNKLANIKTIKDFIKRVVRHIKKQVSNNFDENVDSLDTKLSLAVKQDITVNLEVDLSNIENIFQGKICTVFVTCNGAIAGSLRNRNNSLDPNSVYVKVELKLDDDFNDIKHKVERTAKHIESRRHKAKDYAISARKTVSLRVTRTTLTTSNVKRSTDNLNILFQH